jgi:hypothetical protein
VSTPCLYIILTSGNFSHEYSILSAPLINLADSLGFISFNLSHTAFNLGYSLQDSKQEDEIQVSSFGEAG